MKHLLIKLSRYIARKLGQLVFGKSYSIYDSF